MFHRPQPKAGPPAPPRPLPQNPRPGPAMSVPLSQDWERLFPAFLSDREQEGTGAGSSATPRPQPQLPALRTQDSPHPEPGSPRCRGTHASIKGCRFHVFTAVPHYKGPVVDTGPPWAGQGGGQTLGVRAGTPLGTLLCFPGGGSCRCQVPGQLVSDVGWSGRALRGRGNGESFTPSSVGLGAARGSPDVA